ncbi:hypothetical protein TNIN_451501 [Trichonephila inaurata madagascariensis]|uniref:Uncharacterized protein n=1 Tax=Trichonephila inaurata madagascariensis TaxID=2747483 RepID=A0A8X6I7P7_9ARAC|nr:hypothetical protein TNIN_451501 [Trichonephila inaurata madagascariensis]
MLESFLMHGRQFMAFLRKDYCAHGMWIEVGDVVFPETDEAAFDIMLKEALKMFDEKEEMKEFKRYFEQNLQCLEAKYGHIVTGSGME